MDTHSFLTYILLGETTRMNLFQSLTNAMDIALEKDPTAGKKTMVGKLQLREQ